MEKIAIIGCGNLGQSIAKGLCKSSDFEISNLILTKRSIDGLLLFQSQGVTVTSDNKSAVQASSIIVLALKPYNLSFGLKKF